MHWEGLHRTSTPLFVGARSLRTGDNLPHSSSTLTDPSSSARSTTYKPMDGNRLKSTNTLPKHHCFNQQNAWHVALPPLLPTVVEPRSTTPQREE
jgi:hypothetical protein